jgi:hypothetical protein
MIIHKSKYKDLTVNLPDVVSFHTNLSGCVDKLISMSLFTKCNDLVPLYPMRACLKPMFNGTWEKTSATELVYDAQCCIEMDIEMLMESPPTMCPPKTEY